MANLEGAMLSEYLLLECISRGNVADVYRARHNDANQYEVAIKVFRPGYAGREAFRAYFMYEAEKIGQFDHPHILPFIEYGEGEGLLYAVTPFVKSGTLEDLLKKVGGKFPALQALPILQHLCDAVQYAHEHEVIHGNIKPRNVFVANDGRMLLADFGIARGYSDGQQALAKIDWGAVQYAAPEQSLGLMRRSSDIYALGALCFRLLTGSLVFTGQTPVEVLLKHVRQEAPAAYTLEPGISDEVADVLQKALQKRSDDRYSTAGELSRAFAAAVAIAPVASPLAHPLTPATRALTQTDPHTPMPIGYAAGVTPPPTVSLSWQTRSQTSLASPSPEQPERAASSPLQAEQHANPDISYADRPTSPIPGRAAGASLRPAQEPDGRSPLAEHGMSSAAERACTLPHSGLRQESPEKRQEQPAGRLLPILVLTLLLLGLLAALLSSFLLPAPSGPGSSYTGPHSTGASLVQTHRGDEQWQNSPE
jgi:serine/threonine protein kinase